MTPERNSGAACAHLRITYQTEPCDGPNARGEMTPGLATRGWWECDYGCGCRFTPSHYVAPGERSRIYREELEEVIAGLEFATMSRLHRDLQKRWFDAHLTDGWTVAAREALRAALLPPEGGT